MADYAVMPTADYQAACDAIREKTGDTDAIKSGDMAELIGGISGGGGGFPNGTEWADSNVTNVVINGIEYGNGVWVAATQSGLYYSTDGKTWTASGVTKACTDACYANGIWLAAASDRRGSYCYRSTDGKTWTSSNVSGTFLCLAYGNGTWVAGGSGELYYSTDDGQTWNVASGASYANFEFVSYSETVWLALATSGTGLGLYASDDALEWEKLDVPDSYSAGLCYANGRWAICTFEGIYYSDDGRTWVATNVTSYMEGIYYADGTWLAVGTGCWRSTDGKTWVQVSTLSVYGVYKANGLWVAAGDETGLYYSSDDGETWTQTNATAGTFIGLLTNANGIWVAGDAEGSGLIYSVGWEPS